MSTNEWSDSTPQVDASVGSNTPNRQWFTPMIRGLLWRERLLHQRLVERFVMTWVVLTWVVPLLVEPACLLILTTLYALAAGHFIGGSDAAEGSEEFSLALPPTRRERFLTRLAFGGLPLLLMVGVGTLAAAFDLPQMLWSLFVETGMTATMPPHPEKNLWLAIGVGLPTSAFCVTFSAASIAPSRPVASVAWLTGGLTTLGAVLVGTILEGLFLSRRDGLLTTFLLIAMAAVALRFGYRAYLRKDGISRPAVTTTAGGGGRGIGLFAILFILGLMFVVAMVSYQVVEEKDAAHEAELRARQHATQAEARQDAKEAARLAEEQRAEKARKSQNKTEHTQNEKTSPSTSDSDEAKSGESR